MTVLHSKDTAVKDPSDGEGVLDLGGAYFHDTVGLVMIYRDVALDDIHRFTNNPDDIVHGSSLEDIRVELERLHPCEHPDCTFVARQSYNFETEKWKTADYHDVWLIMDRPIINSDDFELQMQASLALGPILVAHENVGDEVSDENGMVCVERKFGFSQINYNPSAVNSRERNQKRREIRKLNRGRFDKDQLWSLYNMLANWPGDHPFLGAVSPKECWISGGWGSQREAEFGVTDVLELKDATLKLWKEKFWRRKDGRVREVLKELLPFIYAIEDRAIARRDELRARYDEKVAAAEEGDKIPTFNEWVIDAVSGTLKNELMLCRWIRGEVRALGMKMPGRPKMPSLPKRKRKKKRRKKKRVQSKVRSKSLADAPDKS